ncbi:MAG TPA: response regulator transcription factor [Microvirga sp.]|nr:response regulator transcription factor [Microvirga sp.]
MKRRILVVEDDETLRVLLSFLFESEGYKVTAASTAREMHAHLDRSWYDLVLLDLGLPDEDGLVLIRQLRTRSELPIIVLTANQEQETMLAALELGVHDFLRKPFDPREVLLRVKGVLARSAPRSAADESAVLHSDGWTLDLRARALHSPAGDEVPLTPGEFHVLSALMKRPGWALSRDQLLDAVTRGEDPPSPRMVDVYVSQLRSKMEPDTRNPRFLLSVRGYGYKFGGRVE